MAAETLTDKEFFGTKLVEVLQMIQDNDGLTVAYWEGLFDVRLDAPAKLSMAIHMVLTHPTVLLYGQVRYFVLGLVKELSLERPQERALIDFCVTREQDGLLANDLPPNLAYIVMRAVLLHYGLERCNGWAEWAVRTRLFGETGYQEVLYEHLKTASLAEVKYFLSRCKWPLEYDGAPQLPADFYSIMTMCAMRAPEAFLHWVPRFADTWVVSGAYAIAVQRPLNMTADELARIAARNGLSPAVVRILER